MESDIFLPGEHESYWIDSTAKTNFPSLQEDIEVDVAIIGAGIAGLTAAYLLKQEGKKVVVLEARKIVEGVTGYTTAKITSLHTLIYSHLANQLGKEKAKLYGEAQESGLSLIADLVKKHKIDCDFERVPAFTFAWNKEEEKKVKEEAETAAILGLPASFIEKPDLPFKIFGAVKFDNQARFHPRKYLLKLGELINDENNHIFENTRVLDVEENNPNTIITEKGKIKTTDVIVATNYPILNKGMFYTRLTPLRSYVLGVFSKTQIPDGMYISNNSPIFSIRLQPTEKNQMIIITGEEHKTGETQDTISYYKNLEKMAKKYIDISSIKYYWSTQDTYSIDTVPYIGRFTPNSKHLYLATGFGGWGMTNGTVAGILLSDMIIGRQNELDPIFNPSRLEQVKAAKQFISQNISTGKQLVKDKITKPMKTDIDKIKRNEGKVIGENNEKVAVYKDKSGNIITLSPKCTHMGCIVNFNNAEKSWDCPCHGSRFDTNGKVLHGPAVTPLKKK